MRYERGRQGEYEDRKRVRREAGKRRGQGKISRTGWGVTEYAPVRARNKY
jgi:hypothetical protein